MNNQSVINILNHQKKIIFNLKKEILQIKKKPLSELVKNLECRHKALRVEINNDLVDKLSEVNQKFDEYFECPICFCNYDELRKKIVLSCGHKACSVCLVKTFKHKYECPHCRKQNPTFEDDLKFNEKMKTFFGAYDELKKKVKRRKRENEIFRSRKKQLTFKVFWREVNENNIRCKECYTIFKRKNKIKHFVSCKKIKSKLEFIFQP
jgi:thiol-disulfide isomerase/thioredoxin